MFCQFKLNWLFGFALDYRNSFADASTINQISHREFDEIAASQLAINRHVEQYKVTKITC